jgi:hypothetical protein
VPGVSLSYQERISFTRRVSFILGSFSLLEGRVRR